MTKEAYMASIDFKGAHYSFPIHPSYLKNLKVIFDGQLYCEHPKEAIGKEDEEESRSERSKLPSW